jgi:hypothetical protein
MKGLMKLIDDLGTESEEVGKLSEGKMAFLDELKRELQRLWEGAHDETATRYQQEAAYQRLLALQWVEHRLIREPDCDCRSCRGDYRL